MGGEATQQGDATMGGQPESEPSATQFSMPTQVLNAVVAAAQAAEEERRLIQGARDPVEVPVPNAEGEQRQPQPGVATLPRAAEVAP
eukprot:5678744-Lingulodinium_polyedra.AAC.1